MIKALPRRPMMGGTNQGRRPQRYAYWRVGYGAPEHFSLDFWLERAGEFHCKPDFCTGNFDHPQSIQIYLHLAGEATFETEDQVWPVEPGNLLLMPPHSACTYSSEEDLKFSWLALGGSWPPVLGDQPDTCQLLPLEHDATLEAKFVEIREALILRKPGYPLQALGLFYELMARIEALGQAASAPTSAYPEGVRNAVIFLRENTANPFNAAQTAAAVNLSQSHLRALFEKWLGESPRQFHTRCRTDQAKRLLTEQRLTVSEVALQLGFNDVHHFSRVFKRMTGLPPSRYLAQFS